MSARAAVAGALALAALAAPARAQQVEIVPLVGLGYTGGHDFDPVAPEVQQVGLAGGLSWGGRVGVSVFRDAQLELSWVQHQSAVELRSSSGGEGELFDMTIGQLHGGLAYQLGKSTWAVRPFVVGSAGLAFLGAPGLEGDTRFAWALGGGLKTRGDRRLGFELRFRYKFTDLGGEPSDPGCLPFGFCTGTMGQTELMAGLAIRL